ncbi:MAG: hypothetical protein V7641_1309 [Blastocatellia bacterium]
MKLSPFTLIYRPEEEASERAKRRVDLATPAAGDASDAHQRLQEVRQRDPGLAEVLESLNPKLSRTLIASTYAQKLVQPREQVAAKLRRVVTDLQRSEKVVTVAIWDLDAQVGGLSAVIDTINKAQSAFTFFDLRAPVPAGLVIHADLFSQWARKRLGKRFSKTGQQDFQHNFMFSDFYPHAHIVRQQIGVDYLVGITPYMVAWEEGDDVHWDYFSTAEKRVILVSAYHMREYAAQANRPFEAAMAGVIISQLLVIMNKRLSFHEENRGCLFDFNDDRDSIVESLRKGIIEEHCLSLIDEKYRDAAQKVVNALKSYSSKEEKVEEEDPGKPQEDDQYWLDQLTKLSSSVGN